MSCVQSTMVEPADDIRDSSLISTSVRMVHPRRTSDEKRPVRGRQRINPREFATTGPRTPETAANYLLHRGLRQSGSGDQRGVSGTPMGLRIRPVVIALLGLA